MKLVLFARLDINPLMHIMPKNTILVISLCPEHFLKNEIEEMLIKIKAKTFLQIFYEFIINFKVIFNSIKG